MLKYRKKVHKVMEEEKDEIRKQKEIDTYKEENYRKFVNSNRNQ